MVKATLCKGDVLNLIMQLELVFKKKFVSTLWIFICVSSLAQKKNGIDRLFPAIDFRTTFQARNNIDSLFAESDFIVNGRIEKCESFPCKYIYDDSWDDPRQNCHLSVFPILCFTRNNVRIDSVAWQRKFQKSGTGANVYLGLHQPDSIHFDFESEGYSFSDYARRLKTNQFYFFFLSHGKNNRLTIKGVATGANDFFIAADSINEIQINLLAKIHKWHGYEFASRISFNRFKNEMTLVEEVFNPFDSSIYYETRTTGTIFQGWYGSVDRPFGAPFYAEYIFNPNKSVSTCYGSNSGKKYSTENTIIYKTLPDGETYAANVNVDTAFFENEKIKSISKAIGYSSQDWVKRILHGEPRGTLQILEPIFTLFSPDADRIATNTSPYHRMIFLEKRYYRISTRIGKKSGKRNYHHVDHIAMKYQEAEAKANKRQQKKEQRKYARYDK